MQTQVRRQLNGAYCVALAEAAFDSSADTSRSILIDSIGEVAGSCRHCMHLEGSEVGHGPSPTVLVQKLGKGATSRP